MVRLYKCEVAAAVIREAMERRSSGSGRAGISERAPHGLRRTMMRSEISKTFMMSVVSSSVPPAATALPVVTSVLLMVCMGLAIYGTPGVKDIDANFVVRRDLPLSASKKNEAFLAFRDGVASPLIPPFAPGDDP